MRVTRLDHEGVSHIFAIVALDDVNYHSITCHAWGSSPIPLATGFVMIHAKEMLDSE